MVFVNTFGEFDKQTNFSSEQCVDFKTFNGKIKKVHDFIAAAAQYCAVARERVNTINI